MGNKSQLSQRGNDHQADWRVSQTARRESHTDTPHSPRVCMTLIPPAPNGRKTRSPLLPASTQCFFVVASEYVSSSHVVASG
ncbi:hypothetical protein DUNSADRAFT_14595 [Dunaliella salina]|uniref:Encoded protein n=1 Tax=Dunaliella salina TaxID=3046 RepID=A0ABQ7H2F4_DUNSA|nr:hypothetical protein DUNSADRAFT_14595 [Dunaliella salina]|eukprot:KAF5841037.1 hypothetical protein DUNSADRAFT_14595 [Dunaliella salina]